MTKSIITGLLFGVVGAVVVGGVYTVGMVMHNSKVSDVPETKVIYIPQEYAEWVADDISEVESEAPTEVPTYVEPVETTPAPLDVDEEVYTIRYGDADAIYQIPESALWEKDDFLQYAGPAIYEQLFDMEPEWYDYTYSKLENLIHVVLYGELSNGTVEVSMDTGSRTMTVNTEIEPVGVQSREDFVRPGDTPQVTYEDGVTLDEIGAKTVSTIKFEKNKVSDISRMEAAQFGGISQTAHIVISELPNSEQLYSLYTQYLAYYFGSGEVTVWDYEKLENSTIIIYASVGGYNVATQLRGGEPDVLYSTATPSK